MDSANYAGEHQTEYQIQVEGRLDAGWSDWFDGMMLTFENAGDGSPVTTLSGTVVDQAALHGLLSKILDLNLTLISVIRVD
jgi:hypothetical protein